MTESAKILVVEDDKTLREALCDIIQFGGFKVASAVNGAEALVHLKKHSVDLVISDVQMDVMDGHTLLRRVRALKPELPFVLITAHGSVEKAVEAMREGATDYLLKPFEAEVLLEMVSRLTAEAAPQHETGMVAEDPAMTALCDLACRVAASDATVLIAGESGTGKEVMARYIHRQSPRVNEPFIAINCAAIPESMLESMLFGYEKGAYTGAHQSRSGKFEQANGGTLLLDEISEMDLGLQAKLLRVLQEKEVERLGGNALIPLDVRVLATTNRNLREAVDTGKFREDLYYRLNVFPLTIPPLRNRTQDILPLARAMLLRHGGERQLRFTQPAEQRLVSHAWQGNVRELENCIQRAAILATTEGITEADLFFETTLAVDVRDEPQLIAETPSALNCDLKAREKQMIVDTLKEMNGSRKDTAEKLGISPRTLRYKLARLKEQGVAVSAIG